MPQISKVMLRKFQGEIRLWESACLAAAGFFVGRVGSRSQMMKPECLNCSIDKLEDI